MSEWQECKIGEILTEKGYIRGPFGSSLKRGEMKDSGIPVYEQKNAIYSSRDFRFFIDDDKFKELNRFQVRTNDLIISCSGTVGKISIIKEDDPKGIISQALLIMRPDIKKITLLYLYYFLSSRQGFELITQASHGSVQINIAERKVVENIPLLLPPLPEQRAIDSVLSSLDDKIDLLHRQNTTLEAMAETLFRQWFVEEADEGWEEGYLEDIIEFNPKYKLSKENEAPYLEMSNVSIASYCPIGWYDREFKSGVKFKNGDTLFARITPCLENGKTCFVDFLDNEDIVGWGSTEYIVMKMKKPFHPFISYVIAKNEDFREFAISCMTGSSGRQRAKADDIKEYDIRIPPKDVIDKLNTMVSGLVKNLKNNSKQIRTLEKLRDTLLPKLMSGEVRVEMEASL